MNNRVTVSGFLFALALVLAGCAGHPHAPAFAAVMDATCNAWRTHRQQFVQTARDNPAPTSAP